MVRIHPDPPNWRMGSAAPRMREASEARRERPTFTTESKRGREQRSIATLIGAVAQLGEHLLCKQGVVGSIPISSTSLEGRGKRKAFSSDLWIGTEKVRSFFNNMEEVKRLARKGEVCARARVSNGGRDWVRLYRACSIFSRSERECANTCNARLR
jgi:hypothetical protein